MKVLDKKPDFELRETILQRILACRSSGFDDHCPFQLLKKLSHAATLSMISSMDRKTMLKLLKVECPCCETSNCDH